MARDGEHAWRRATGLCHRRSGWAYMVLPADHDQPLALAAAAELCDALNEPRTANELLERVLLAVRQCVDRIN